MVPRTNCYSHNAFLLFKILMHNFYQFFCSRDTWIVGFRLRINHVLADMVFDYLGDEPVESSAAGRRLLEHSGAFLVRVDGSFNGLDLTAQASEPNQELRFFLRNMTHNYEPPVVQIG